MLNLAGRVLLLAAFLLAPGQLPADGTRGDDIEAFVDEMVDKHGFDRERLSTLLGGAEVKESILRAISRPAEAKPWYEYRPIFVTRLRIEGGIEYWSKHEDLLERAYRTYGVDPAIIVAIIGVETRYGNHAGRYRVLDALRTLAFDYPPRAAFFRKELEEFLLLVREEDIDPAQALGSYAGAMGHGQFIPSSYRRYAVDFDGDGKRDLWHSAADVIGSVANYLASHGWQADRPVTTPADVDGERFRPLLDRGLEPHTRVSRMRDYGVDARLPVPGDIMATLMEFEQPDGKEYWIGLENFYVITRYNHSFRYAMAVYQLGDEIAVTRAINRDE